MNLDELAGQLESDFDDPVIRELAIFLLEWKDDDSTVIDLRNNVERLVGNRWFERDEDHSEVYALWAGFRDNEIDRIGGMTMNERLYTFSLFERYDLSTNDESRLVIYRKLLASP